ncbi:MAG: undecaprenyl-diphosphate phosphatase [Elusimicrobiota bacterium]
MPDLSSCIILGFVQGLTEFLPVSSSAHLVIFQKIFGWTGSNILFDVLVHLGTLLSVVILLWNEIKQVLSRPRYFLLVFSSTLTTVVVVLPFRKLIERTFESTEAVAFFLLVTGFILLAVEAYLHVAKSKEIKKLTDIRLIDSILIGVAQGIAVLPGISRSGATIAAGIFSRIERRNAAKYSFLISIPAVLGANILELKDIQFNFSEISAGYLAGMFVAFISGLLAVYFMVRLLNKFKFWWFALYCWFLGALILIGERLL